MRIELINQWTWLAVDAHNDFDVIQIHIESSPRYKSVYLVILGLGFELILLDRL